MKEHANDHGHDHDHNVQVKVERLSSTKVKLTLEFGADTVKNHEKSTLQKYANQARIPGFRPGKAPLKMVHDKFKDDIQRDLVSHLVEAGLHEGIVKSNLMPLNRPKISLKDVALGVGKPFVFDAEFEVHPEVKLKNYKGVPLKKISEEIPEEEVAKTIENIRERLGVLEPIADAKKAEKGQYAVVDIGFDFPENPSKSEKARPYNVELGTDKIFPELDAAFLEMTVGENRKIPGHFPENYNDKDLAGKPVVFDCTLQEVKKKTLPVADDAMANQLKEGGTLETLKEEIRSSIKAAKLDDGKRAQRNEVIEYLIKQHQFEVPASLVEDQSQSLLKWMEQDMKSRGVGTIALQDEELKQVRVRAEQMVRSTLILKEIAVAEKITFDEAKFEEKVAQIAQQLQRSVDETKKFLSGRGMVDQIRDEIMTDQIFDFLISNGKVS